MKAVVIKMKREQIQGTLREVEQVGWCWVPDWMCRRKKTEDDNQVSGLGNGKEVGNMGGGGGLREDGAKSNSVWVGFFLCQLF